MKTLYKIYIVGALQLTTHTIGGYNENFEKRPKQTTNTQLEKKV